MSGIVKIEVITGMSKLTDLIQNLSKVGVRGATVMQVLGCGIEMGTPEYEVERNEVMELLPKQQINIVVEAEKVDKIVDIIKKELYTGHIGDALSMVETQKIHEKFKLSCIGMTYPRAFWRFMEIFLSGCGFCAALYIPIVCICDKIDLLFTRKRPRSLRSYSERGRCAFS